MLSEKVGQSDGEQHTVAGMLCSLPVLVYGAWSNCGRSLHKGTIMGPLWGLQGATNLGRLKGRFVSSFLLALCRASQLHSVGSPWAVCCLKADRDSEKRHRN